MNATVAAIEMQPGFFVGYRQQRMEQMQVNAVETNTGPNPAWSLIFLHGLGADGHDFAPLPGQMRLPAAVRFVFPHAPVTPVTINGGLAMPAWYDILTLDWNGPEDAAGVRNSARDLQRLISRETERGIPSSRIFIGGFSQGGSVALFTGPRHPDPLAGIIALSTWMPQPATLAAENSEANRSLPVFMAHGTHDSTIPMMFGARARDQLREQGHDVDWHTYPLEHAVSAQEIADLNDWLAARLQAPE